MGIVRVLNQFLVCNIAFVLVDALFINFEVPSTICRIEEEKDFVPKPFMHVYNKLNFVLKNRNGKISTFYILLKMYKIVSTFASVMIDV